MVKDTDRNTAGQTARQTAPPQGHKVARRVGMAAPAVVVLGALAAVSQVHSLASSPPAGAGHRTTARVAGHQTTAHRGDESHVLSASDSIVPAKLDAFRQARRAMATVASHARRSAKTTTGTSRGTSAAPDNSASRPGTAAAPSSAATPSGPAAPSGPATPACSGTAGMLPANYGAIVDFLTAHGYTGVAAAGIAGNIYQESMGNPESVGSGGGGLIGWTPLPAGFVTGNPAADLQTQLAAILTFNRQWAQYIPALNAATSPTEAADIYVTDFERAGIPAFSNREAAANAVAAACGL
jgi:hypothetical protein